MKITSNAIARREALTNQPEGEAAFARLSGCRKVQIAIRHLQFVLPAVAGPAEMAV